MTRYIKITVDTGFHGAAHEDEVPLPDEWDAWSEKQRNEYLWQLGSDFMHERIEVVAEVKERA